MGPCVCVRLEVGTPQHAAFPFDFPQRKAHPCTLPRPRRGLACREALSLERVDRTWAALQSPRCQKHAGAKSKPFETCLTL